MPLGEWAVTLHQNLAHQWPVGVSVESVPLVDYYQTVSELHFLGTLDFDTGTHFHSSMTCKDEKLCTGHYTQVQP